MRRFFATLAAIALLPAMPALAQSVHDTHVEQAGTSGKTPTKSYRPLARETCRTATNHHQTGKIPLTPQAAASSTCQTELAARETNERRD
ncbi:hypothetical protein HL653_14185 [Sphingomonas sp. AP4-R1]|uniref:hypothetical protein n=1 Tax=Sphingomonas sp. AP4-R1 TaxID=2735134 RepID=UPI001493DA0D|nr:hypothetical protein [Sphingomonas sp. AP4-R1]QJU58762.1 hypothetical protein HL653_14185 [Sphingomonas sp. AP4-R1]